MDPNRTTNHDGNATVHELHPAVGHLSRARSRAGAAASKVADRIWGPAIDRHLHEADRNGFTGRDYAEAAERVALREEAARRDPLAALALASGVLTVNGKAVA